MTTHTLTPIVFACALLLAACGSKPPGNKNLQGAWKSKDGSTNLKITDKQFTLDNEAEDYFVKGDTVFTSFEGNRPYTKWVIQKLDDKTLSLVFPDSTAVEFSR